MKRTFTEIMEEMDALEKVEISDEIIAVMKKHFEEDIEREKASLPLISRE